jgi:hypothetical protein
METNKEWSEPFNKIRWGQAVNTVSSKHDWNEDFYALCLARYKQLEQLEHKAELHINAERRKTVDDAKQLAGVLEL